MWYLFINVSNQFLPFIRSLLELCCHMMTFHVQCPPSPLPPRQISCRTLLSFAKDFFFFFLIQFHCLSFTSSCLSCPLFQRIKYGQLCTMICKCKLLWEATAQISSLCCSSTTVQQWTRFLPLPVALNTVSSLSPILARCPGCWIHQVGWEWDIH